jgi:hypothetical protein
MCSKATKLAECLSFIRTIEEQNKYPQNVSERLLLKSLECFDSQPLCRPLILSTSLAPREAVTCCYGKHPHLPSGVRVSSSLGSSLSRPCDDCPNCRPEPYVHQTCRLRDSCIYRKCWKGRPASRKSRSAFGGVCRASIVGMRNIRLPT